jgi:polyketide synthase PksM
MKIMRTEQIKSADTNSLIYALNHVIKPSNFAEILPNCTFVINEKQTRLYNELKTITNSRILFCNDIIESEIYKVSPSGRIVFLSRTDWDISLEEANSIIVDFFHFIKKLQSNTQQIKLDIVTFNAIENPLLNGVSHPIDAALVGFSQTLTKEMIEWDVKTLCLSSLSSSLLCKSLNYSDVNTIGKPVCFNDQYYSYPEMHPAILKDLNTKVDSKFEVNGTYLIIGANGGIGGLLSNYLATNYNANLILVGRSSSNEKLCKQLIEFGAKSVNYESVRIENEEEVNLLFSKYKNINGIVHSALVLEDSTISTMTETGLVNVLKSKVDGTINIINSIKNKSLDFVLFFSSIQSYIANAGQANYSAACVCKDALASLLHNAFMIDSKVINWGFWGNFGIVASEKYRERMQKLEIGSIEAIEGLNIIERLLISDIRQITVIKASNKALHRLDITPHRQEEKMAVSNLLETIIPVFNDKMGEVKYNINMATELQRYSRSLLQKIQIPIDVHPKYEKLINALRNISKESEQIRREDLLREFPSIIGHVNLLEKCINNYQDIFEDKISPLTVMFPDGSFDLVEPVYRDNPIADYFNKIAANITNNYIHKFPKKKIRILEIGAGTGSTTQFVLPYLNSENTSYLFTDLSYAFLNKARKKFNQYSFVDYKIFNVETPFEEEDYFDIVIATNVIHATSNLNQTLSNVYKLLKEDGVFILNEITSCQDYATLTFGLTEGWWLATDEYRIPNSPLLTGDNWKKLLLKANFSEVKSHGNEEQQIIVSHKSDVNFKQEELNIIETEKPERFNDPESNNQLSIGKQQLSKDEVKKYIKKQIAEVLFLSIHEIEDEQPFNEIGIDSLITMEILKPFKEDLGYLPATLFFEYHTVEQLSQYLIEEFEVKLSEILLTDKNIILEIIKEENNVSLEKDQQTLVFEKSNRKSEETTTTHNLFIRQLLKDIMGFEDNDMDDDQPFMEMGIDSIISLELLKPIRENFGYVPATIFFEYSTINSLNEYLVENFNTIGVSINEKEEELSIIKPHDDEIAIIGMAGQFPEASDIFALWKNLKNGKDSISEIPKERWAGKTNDAKVYTTKGGFISDIDAFDNEFFNFTPLDSEKTDPQERLFLQNVYQLLLDSGYSKSDINNTNTGVFVGVMNAAYSWHTSHDTDAIPTSLFWSIANRVSYYYNLHGPSMAVDTACSASLSSLHVAIRALQAGDCDQAVVGGVNLIVHPNQFKLLCGMHMLSKSGSCKSFGKGADGFVDAEGVCSILLKPYKQAIKDNDRIYATIKSSSLNSGGKANGYSAPNPEYQANLIKKAIQSANLSPSDIDYIEAHGTGTELGDPIEIRALSQVFKDVNGKKIKIGSIKSNIGHLESAAGLSGLIKAVLQMHKGYFVPSLNSEEENPHIDFEKTPFVINKKLEKWAEGKNKISSVSSFGAGGSNAHVILAGFNNKEYDSNRHPLQFYNIPISSQTLDGLQLQINQLRRFLYDEENRSIDLYALTYTLACTRDHWKYRIVFRVQNIKEFIEYLKVDLQNIDNKFIITSINYDISQDDRIVHFDREIINYIKGQNISWNTIYLSRKVCSLPGYSFSKNRFWIKSKESNFNSIDSLIEQHQISGKNMLPGAWIIAELITKNVAKKVSNIIWNEPITNWNEIQYNEIGDEFKLLNTNTNTVVCSGSYVQNFTDEMQKDFYNDMNLAEWKEKDLIYEDFGNREYHYGHQLQGLQWVKLTDKIAKGHISISTDWGMSFSPAIIDSGLQLAILLTRKDQFTFNSDKILVPYYLENLYIKDIPKNGLIYCYCIHKDGNAESNYKVFDYYFTDINNKVLLYLENLTSIRVNTNDSYVSEEQINNNNVIVYDL